MSETSTPPGHEIYYINGGWRYTDDSPDAKEGAANDE